MLMAKPFNRTFTLAAGTTLYEGCLEFNRMFREASDVEGRMAMLRDPAYRDAVRTDVEYPNRDPAAGPTLPPPRWSMLLVNRVARPDLADHAALVGRTVADLAAEQGRAPADVMLDLALAEDLQTEWLWATESDAWRTRTRTAGGDPHMIVGVSDGGARLDRDDSSEWSSWFFDRWVREWKGWTLKEAVRLMTQIPASFGRFQRPRTGPPRVRGRPDGVRPRHDRARPQGVRPRLPQRGGPLALMAQGRARHHRQRRAHRHRRRDHRRTPRRRRPPVLTTKFCAEIVASRTFLRKFGGGQRRRLPVDLPTAALGDGFGSPA